MFFFATRSIRVVMIENIRRWLYSSLTWATKSERRNERSGRMGLLAGRLKRKFGVEGGGEGGIFKNFNSIVKPVKCLMDWYKAHITCNKRNPTWKVSIKYATVKFRLYYLLKFIFIWFFGSQKSVFKSPLSHFTLLGLMGL